MFISLLVVRPFPSFYNFKRRDDVGKRNDQDTTELPTLGALTRAQLVTYSLKEPQDASVIERGGGGAESMKGVGGDQSNG